MSLVDPTKWENMEGETDTIKKLNSYLTCHFIIESDLPADECLSEAIAIESHKEWVEFEIADYLADRFSHKGKGEYEGYHAREILKIIRKGG